MADHEVTFPITDEREILKLRAGDEVVVQGHIIGIRDRTQMRIFDQGVEPPMDLRGAFLLHTAPNVRRRDDGGYDPICIGTTTSARMVRFTEPLGARYGVRGICGKGGFPDEAIEPMREHGMVYFAIVGRGLERKLEVLRDKPVVIGGTFFEVVYARERLDEYKRWLAGLGLTHVEISDGTVEIPRERKLELIEEFARDFTVLSEVGSKDSEVVFAPYEWVGWIKEERDAGAWKVITEAREGGNAGIL